MDRQHRPRPHLLALVSLTLAAATVNAACAAPPERPRRVLFDSRAWDPLPVGTYRFIGVSSGRLTARTHVDARIDATPPTPLDRAGFVSFTWPGGPTSVERNPEGAASCTSRPIELGSGDLRVRYAPGALVPLVGYDARRRLFRVGLAHGVGQPATVLVPAATISLEHCARAMSDASPPAETERVPAVVRETFVPCLFAAPDTSARTERVQVAPGVPLTILEPRGPWRRVRVTGRALTVEGWLPPDLSAAAAQDAIRYVTAARELRLHPFTVPAGAPGLVERGSLHFYVRTGDSVVTISTFAHVPPDALADDPTAAAGAWAAAGPLVQMPQASCLPPPPRLRSASPAAPGSPIRGALSKEAIRRVIQRHIDEVRICYEQRLDLRPRLAGRIVFSFAIQPGGDVALRGIPENTFDDHYLADCIGRALRNWSFPRPDGGGLVVVNYPFMLTTGPP